MNHKPSRGRLRHPGSPQAAATPSTLRVHHLVVMVLVAFSILAAARSQRRSSLSSVQEIADVATTVSAPTQRPAIQHTAAVSTPARGNGKQVSSSTRHMRINVLMNRIASAPKSPDAIAAMGELKRELAAAGVRSVQMPR